jgi:hypothetical protein
VPPLLQGERRCDRQRIEQADMVGHHNTRPARREMLEPVDFQVEYLPQQQAIEAKQTGTQAPHE